MLTIKVDGNSIRRVMSLARQVQAARMELANRSKPLEKIKRKQVRRWMHHLRSDGSEYGGWTPLADATVKRRGSSSPILIQTGRMLGWVNTQNNAGIVSAQSIHWSITGDGSGGSYAVFHDSGSRNVPWSTRNPRRKVWELDEKDQDQAEEEMTRYVDSILKTYFS